MLVGLWLWSAIAAATPGEDLMSAGRLAEAYPVVQAEAEQAPTDVAAQERWIDLLLTLGLADVAVAECKTRVDAAPGSADAHYLLARALPTAEAADAEYDKALAIDANHARSLMGKGAVYRAKGRSADAETSYARAVAIDPSLTEAWTGLVTARLQRGDQDGAIAAAQASVTQNGGAADGWLAEAVLDPTDAEHVLATAAKKFPRDPRVFIALAEVRLAHGDGKAAGEAVAKALAIDPDRSEARLASMFAASEAAGTLDAVGYKELIGTQGIESSDPMGAAAKYDAMVERYPSCPLVFMSRARVKARGGDSAGAEADLRTALKFDPQNDEAQAALGIVLRDQKRYADARPYLEHAQAARPSDISLALALDQTIADLGDRAEASRRLAALSDDAPADARVALIRAKVLSDAGDKEGAYTVLRDALDRIPDGRLIVALAAAAKDLGRIDDAAKILDAIAKRTGNPAWSEIATKMRASAPTPARPAGDVPTP